MSLTTSQQPEYDLIGCGFGPANIGIAVALLDSHQTRQKQALFIERHPDFRWHPGMLIPGAKMQISCLKDLATLRDPKSRFTFLSYLHVHGRLPAFINRGSTIPSRREFADYLSWVAREVVAPDSPINVAYSEEVVSLSKITLGGREWVEVTSRKLPSGDLLVRRAKNIILSSGGSPRIPRVLSSLLPSPEGWSASGVLSVPLLHTANYCTVIDTLLSSLSATSARRGPLKIAVVGGGQSSAECLLNLHSRLESLGLSDGLHGQHEIDMIIRKGSLKPSDDSPFVNEIFDPASTDMWYDLPSDRLRTQIHAEYKNTNYSVVNPITIENLYELMYEQKLTDDIAARSSAGASDSNLPPVRVNLRVNQNVVGASLIPNSVPNSDMQKILLIKQDTRTHVLSDDTYDAVLCGTGYDRTAWIRLLRASNFAHEFGLGTPAVSARREEYVEDRYEKVGERELPVKLVPAHYDHSSPPLSSPPYHVSLSLDTEGGKKDGMTDLTTIASQALGMVTVAPKEQRISLSFGNKLSEENPELGSESDDSLTPLSSPSSPIISPTETSNTSLLASSLVMSDSGKKRKEEVDEVRVRISRAYQLLPEKSLGLDEHTEDAELRKTRTKIYIQGSAEATHGLSDSLLSVISVRSGEVVRDMFED